LQPENRDRQFRRTQDTGHDNDNDNDTQEASINQLIDNMTHTYDRDREFQMVVHECET